LVDLADTPKILGSGSAIQSHPERSEVKAAQTPQGFLLDKLLKAHLMAVQEGWACTDDSSLWDRYVGPVRYIPGERKNKKITYREDLEPMEPSEWRIGEGWDIHPLVEGRPLLLGGCRIEFPRGEAGHSDGDALWHAVIDALLGAAGLGDIGTHFPPSDAKWKDADSCSLAFKAIALIRAEGWEIGNIDCTVMLEKPRLQPYREAIKARMGEILEVEPRRISIKAKSYEGFGEVGEGLAVETRAVVLLVQGRRQEILRKESK
jgi:2-C-methyl-D-erythritol 4-phosphate cytidylyltransferase/2-C-methyl-D-erythritol 2,4-cyclodiphosphate synthase